MARLADVDTRIARAHSELATLQQERAAIVGALATGDPIDLTTMRQVSVRKPPVIDEPTGAATGRAREALANRGHR